MSDFLGGLVASAICTPNEVQRIDPGALEAALILRFRRAHCDRRCYERVALGPVDGHCDNCTLARAGPNLSSCAGISSRPNSTKAHCSASICSQVSTNTCPSSRSKARQHLLGIRDQNGLHGLRRRAMQRKGSRRQALGAVPARGRVRLGRSFDRSNSTGAK